MWTDRTEEPHQVKYRGTYCDRHSDPNKARSKV